MARKIIWRSFLGAVLLLAALTTLVWSLWVPSPQEPPYVLAAVWGEPGSGPGQFHDPTGIAVTATEVFVADARNGRIQVFDPQGGFKRAFGQGRLGRPMNLAIARGELYVADYWHDRIQVFGLDGTPHRAVGQRGARPGELNAPSGIAVAPTGDLYVADFANQRVQHLHADGSFVRQWGTTGRPGWRAGEFIYPTDVALAPDGRLYVADGYADRVQVFNPDGSYSRKWGGPFALNIHGPFPGWFATVTSLAIGPGGHVYAADFYNDRVQKFTPEGGFLAAFGASAQGREHTAIAVAVAEDGTVFVADYGNNRVQKWMPACKMPARN